MKNPNTVSNDLLARGRFLISRLAAVVSAAALTGAGIASAAVFYVKTTGSDAASGASWALAKSSVTNAMASATAGDQIWVATGIYTQLVTMKADVSLYGGFNGTETTLAQRNWIANATILYGNSQGTVVTITSGGPNTRLDGFTITGGGSPNTTYGGGINCVAASPAIANNVIYNNRANGGAGGGIYLYGSSPLAPSTTPMITNNIVYQNACLGITAPDGSSYGDGGGIAIGNSSPIIFQNRIIGNLAARHGGGLGLWENSQALIANNIIEGNACSLGFAAGIGGGILASANDFNDNPTDGICSPTIVNNLIAANGAASGGGLALVDSLRGGATLINNTIVANNGSGVFWGSMPITNYNNLIAFNSSGLETAGNNIVTQRNNDVYGNSVLSKNTDYVGTPDATGLNGNISADPLFANFPMGETELEPGSPCINSGLTSVALAIPDLNGSARVQGGVVDMGAFESSGAVVSSPTRVIHVSPAGNDANDGLTWAGAKRTVAAAIGAIGVPIGGEIWCAQGTYSNHILIPQFVYLYGGFTGSENSRASRNVAAHPTLLDGGGQPTVVLSQGAGYLVSTVDGFTIQNGGVYTAGNMMFGGIDAKGGAINCNVSAPIIANNIIQSNSIGTPYNTTGLSHGGGVYLYLAHAQIKGNTFQNNDVLDYTAGSGGAIYCAYSKPCISQNSFTFNRSTYGPAIHAYVSSPMINGNSFLSNNYYYAYLSFYQAGATEGAVYVQACDNFTVNGNTFQGNWANFGGGLDMKGVSLGQVENNTFFANLAENPFSQTGFGGAIFCSVLDGAGRVVMANNTIVSNTAPGFYPGPTDQGGGIWLDLTNNNLFVLANNIIAFNSGGIAAYGSANPSVYGNNCVINALNYTGISAGAGDIHSDPQFVNRAGDFHLLPSSPCIDAGMASYPLPYDKDNTPRPLDGNNDGTAAFDIGAFEYVHPLADTDHDGMPDAAEVTAGTDPTSAASVLKLQASAPATGNSIILIWPSVAGRTYSIQYKSTIVGGTWQTLTNNLQGTGSSMQVSDAISNAAVRFYRLGVAKN